MSVVTRFDQIATLIENGNTAKARIALKTMLKDQPNNAQAWWLYAQVAEDTTAQRKALQMVVRIPDSPYAARAKSLLATMSQNMPKAKATSKSTLPVSMMIVAALSVVTIFGGVLLLTNSNASPAPAAAAVGSNGGGNAAVDNSANNGANNGANNSAQPAIVIVTRDASTIPTVPPLPTATQRPERTAVPLSTPIPTEAAVATARPILAEALPPLNAQLHASVAQLENARNNAAALLADPAQYSRDIEGDIADAEDVIQSVRNDMMLVNTGSVIMEVRRDYILPAHRSFIDYANAILTWIDLKQEVGKATFALGKASETTRNRLTTRLERAQTALTAYEATLQNNRDAFYAALDAYDVLTNMEALDATLPSQAELATSQDQFVMLESGSFTIQFRTKSGEAPANIWLVANETGEKTLLSIEEANTLVKGSYRIETDAAGWWVVAIIPA
jgi:hypothetical protein